MRKGTISNEFISIQTFNPKKKQKRELKTFSILFMLDGSLVRFCTAVCNHVQFVLKNNCSCVALFSKIFGYRIGQCDIHTLIE